jgi:hypothetical protein
MGMTRRVFGKRAALAAVVGSLLVSGCGVHVAAHLGTSPAPASASAVAHPAAADQTLTAEAINALPIPPSEWTMTTLTNLTDRSLVNGGTCLEPTTFATSVAGTRLEYVRNLQPNGQGHGSYLVSVRATGSHDAAMMQLTALQHLTMACANQIAADDVPGLVLESATAVRPLQLALPSASFRTIAHFRASETTADTYIVDLVYLVAGRLRATVGFYGCCQPIDDAFETTVLNQTITELNALAKR